MKIHHYFTKKVKGFGLIEIVVGLGILALSFVGIITVGQTFLRMSVQSVQETQANFLLEEGVEVVRSFRDISWSNIENLNIGTKYYFSFSDGTWATSTTLVLIDNRFERKFFVSSVNRDSNDNISPTGTIDSGTRKITVTVDWRTPVGTSTKTAMIYLTNI